MMDRDGITDAEMALARLDFEKWGNFFGRRRQMPHLRDDTDY